MYKLLPVILLILAHSVYSKEKGDEKQKHKKAKKIILLIGDGMGLTHLYTGYTVNKGNLNIERFKYIGIQKTYSLNDYITDSGASATAIATGEKTNNKMIGLRPDSTVLKSIIEIAEDNQIATGLVATVTITHATPAAFFAHQPYRYMYEEIALDFLKTDIDLFISGGKKYFANRTDGLNLIDSLKARKYDVLFNLEEIDTDKMSKVACFTADTHNVKMVEGRGDLLPNAVEKAIQVLDNNEKGFFLMAEGSQIDWGGHANDQDYLITELVDFDNAVGKALDFAEKDGNTLVIVTADHETGGIGIKAGNLEKGVIELGFTSTQHTGVWVPVFAYGPGAEEFIGFYENNYIFNKMIKAFGFLVKN